MDEREPGQLATLEYASPRDAAGEVVHVQANGSVVRCTIDPPTALRTIGASLPARAQALLLILVGVAAALLAYTIVVLNTRSAMLGLGACLVIAAATVWVFARVWDSAGLIVEVEATPQGIGWARRNATAGVRGWCGTDSLRDVTLWFANDRAALLIVRSGQSDVYAFHGCPIRDLQRAVDAIQEVLWPERPRTLWRRDQRP